MACSAPADPPTLPPPADEPVNNGPVVEDPGPKDPLPEDPVPAPQCKEMPSSLIYVETFKKPLDGWTAFTTDPADPDHTWTILHSQEQGGYLASDPSGWTLQDYENRMDSPAFSLKGATRGYVRFRTRFQHNGTFQVLMDNGVNRVQIADLEDKNPSWPALDCVEIPVPNEFIGHEAVHLSLLMVGGDKNGHGAEIDNLRVATRSCQEGSVPEGGAPVLPNHRKFTIQRCTDMEASNNPTP